MASRSTASGLPMPTTLPRLAPRPEVETQRDVIDGPLPKWKKRRKRKGSHTLRKEEKDRLLKEMAALRAQMKELKQRAMRSFEPDKGAKEKDVANRVLRRTIQDHQNDTVQLDAIVSEYLLFNTCAGSPVHSIIKLGKHQSERHATLLGLRPKVFENAERFFRARFPRLDLLKPMRDDRCVEAPNGDFCCTFVSVVQFEDTSCVRQVFTGVMGYVSNMEIRISEGIGSITVREDDDQHIPGLTQNRFVSSTSPSGLLMESNTIFFARCDDIVRSDGSVHTEAIIVCDFVDEDELYPYQPARRTRRDSCAVFHFTTCRRPTNYRPSGTSSVSSDAGSEEIEEVVVLAHWVHLRLHYPTFDLSPSGWRELRECSEHLLRTLQRSFYHPHVAETRLLSFTNDAPS